MNQSPDMFTLKRWHLILSLLVMLFSAGVQIGLSIAKFGELEREDTSIKARLTTLEDALREVPTLAADIKSLKSDLQFLRDYEVVPKARRR